MAENLNCDVLQLQQCIKRANLFNQEIETEYFLVVSINRYLSDPKHVSQTGKASSQYLDVYELTITDLKHKARVLLTSSLNRLVQLNQKTIDQILKTEIPAPEIGRPGSSDSYYRKFGFPRLWVGCAVKFTSCQLFYDEADLSGKTVIVVNMLDVMSHEDVDVEETNMIAYYDIDDCSI